MQKQKIEQRLLPIEKQDKNLLQDKDINYQIFSLFQINSYLYEGEQKIRYCLKSAVTQTNFYKQYCDSIDIGKKPVCFKTFRKYWKILFDAKMIQEDTLVINNKTIEVYVLPENYKFYQLISLETMHFLAHTMSSDAIRIFLYLLNKSQMKQNYLFTCKELASEALGCSEKTTGVEKRVADCLELLSWTKFIEFTDGYIANSAGKPSPAKMLIKVRADYQEVKKLHASGIPVREKQNAIDKNDKEVVFIPKKVEKGNFNF